MGANLTLRDVELTPFWNHLACVERSRNVNSSSKCDSPLRIASHHFERVKLLYPPWTAWQEKSRSAFALAKKTTPTRRPKIWISFPESPQKTNSKGKKKERNFQPLQSDHYGLLEVNQPVPLPRSLFDGFPHGISTIFVHQIFIPKKAKKANGCIPFVGISFFGFVKSQKRKKQQRQFSPPESFHHHPHHLLHFHLQHWLAIHPAG